MKEIPLTQGKVALVDDADYDWLMQWKWRSLPSGYVIASIKGKTTYIHRLIAKANNGDVVDHINFNKLDNQRQNLRIATQRQNCTYQRKRQGKTSQFKGVSWDKQYQKWRAQIKVNGSAKTIGRFTEETDAALAYDSAAQTHFGAFAQLNF